MTILDAKRKFVIETATGLFLERPVGAVTVKDIAAASGLGEATIYRYFSGKGELLVACALSLQEKIVGLFEDQGTPDGFSGLARFYRAYLETFRNSPELYRFLSEFDAYCHNGGVDLEEYADNIDRFKGAFTAAYERGLSDGSVRNVENVSLFYYSTAHALLALCKKLAAEGTLIRQDYSTDRAAEVETLIELILSSLKA